MINADRRLYKYATIGALNEYAQPQQPKEDEFINTIKMAIYTTSQGVQDNINYKNANYIGLTQDVINDGYIIMYENKKLKVLYVMPKGKYKQVYMSET